MALLIPERTIDSLFTFELISAAPTAIVVSPNNNRGPRTPDHEVSHATRKFVFECKTIYVSLRSLRSGRRLSLWTVQVPVQQLVDYVNHGQGSLIYVLPARPTNTRMPWIRACRDDPDANGYCIACANPTRSQGAVFLRRWAGRQQPIASAPAETRLQPWFNHWAWCVPAAMLAAHIATTPSHVRGRVPRSYAELPARDLALEAIPGAIRFCHLLAAMQRDHDRIHGIVRSWSADEATSESPQIPVGEDQLKQLSTRSLRDLVAQEDDRRLIVGY